MYIAREAWAGLNSARLTMWLMEMRKLKYSM